MSLRKKISSIRTLWEKVLQKNKLYDIDGKSADAKEMAATLSSMLGISYAAIGGYSGGSDLSDFRGYFVADVDEDPEVDIGLFYKQKAGIKIAALGTDGESHSKKAVMDFLEKLLEKPGTWIEASDAVANLLLKKKGLKSLDDEKIVRKAVGKDLVWHGKHPEGVPYGTGWYSREIDGVKRTKILIGRPI